MESNNSPCCRNCFYRRKICGIERCTALPISLSSSYDNKIPLSSIDKYVCIRHKLINDKRILG